MQIIKEWGTKKIVPKLAYFILVLGVFFIFFGYTGYNKDWSSQADQEFTMAYNGVVVNSGYVQEFLDHPGYFTIRFVGLAEKIAYYAGYLSFKNIDELNNSADLFSSFQKLSTIARICAVISGLAILSLLYRVAFLVTASTLCAALVFCLGIFSSGLIFHLGQYRTEPIALLFLLFSCYWLYKICCCRPDDNRAISYLILVIACFYCSWINKSQLIFYAPIYYFCTIEIFTKNLKSKLVFNFDRFYKFSFLLILNIIFFIYLASPNKLSQWFVILFIPSLNFLVAFFCYKKGIEIFRSLQLFNLFYFLGFIFLFIAIWLLDRPNLKTLFVIKDPLQILLYVRTLNHPNEFFVDFLFNSDLSNSIRVLFLSSVACIFLARKYIDYSTYRLIAVCAIGFSMSLIISSFRWMLPHYVLLSEPFLFAIILLALRDFKKKLLAILVILLTLFVSIWLNSNLMYRTLMHDRGDSRILGFCQYRDTFFMDWHRRINREKFYLECQREFPDQGDW